MSYRGKICLTPYTGGKRQARKKRQMDSPGHTLVTSKVLFFFFNHFVFVLNKWKGFYDLMLRNIISIPRFEIL